MFSAALAATTIVACTSPTPNKAFVEEGAAALGGRARLAAVETLTIEGDGTEGNLGQDMTPEATGQAFALSDYTRTFDLGRQSARTRQTRTPNFVYYQGREAQTQELGIDHSVAYDVRANGTAVRASAATAAGRRAAFFHHPLTIARLALDPSTRVTSVRTEGTERLADMVAPDGLTLTLAIDSESHVPTRVQSRMAHPDLGDVIVETRFADYAAVKGLSLPTLLTTTVDGVTVRVIRVQRQTLDDAEAERTAAPGTVAAAPESAAEPPPVDVNDVTPGVWQLAGQSHHSALVEMADHLVLFEAPQSEARTIAVIAMARELRPGKPLTRVVNTHHHFDHSGGLRAAIAEGLTVVTLAGNRGFVETIADRPFTIAPDTLAANPRPVEIVTVGDELTFEDGLRTIVLYPIEGNPHGDLLLMAYLPKERILIEADAFSPGGDYHPYAANLLENVRKRKLRVDTIVPLHGDVVPFSQLVEVAAAAAK